MKSKSKPKLMFANVSVFEKCVFVVAVVAAAAVVLVSFFPLQNCQSLVSHTISFALPRVSIGTSASCWIFLYVVVSSSFSTAAAAAAASVVFFSVVLFIRFASFSYVFLVCYSHTYSRSHRYNRTNECYALLYFLGNARVLLIVSCKKLKVANVFSRLIWLCAFSLTHTIATCIVYEHETQCLLRKCEATFSRHIQFVECAEVVQTIHTFIAVGYIQCIAVVALNSQILNVSGFSVLSYSCSGTHSVCVFQCSQCVYHTYHTFGVYILHIFFVRT